MDVVMNDTGLDVSMPNMTDLAVSTPVKPEPKSTTTTEVKPEPTPMANVAHPATIDGTSNEVLDLTADSSTTRSITLETETRSSDTEASGDHLRAPTSLPQSPPAKMRRCTRSTCK